MDMEIMDILVAFLSVSSVTNLAILYCLGKFDKQIILINSTKHKQRHELCFFLEPNPNPKKIYIFRVIY